MTDNEQKNLLEKLRIRTSVLISCILNLTRENFKFQEIFRECLLINKKIALFNRIF